MNPVLIHIGPINIYWYSFILLIAFVIGFLIFLKEGEKKGISKDIIYDYGFYLIIISLLGARIYYVIFEFGYYIKDPIAIFKVWEGGLAIHGGILAGSLFTYFYTKKKNISFFKFTDILVLCLILGQVLGRWGNFFNGEAFGPPTSLEFLKSLHLPNFIIEGMHIGYNYYHPTFLYESLWNLVGFVILIIIYKKCKESTSSAVYLIHYGIGRFFIEILRQDSLMIGNIKMAMLVSIFMILFGVFILIKRRTIKNGKRI